MRPVWNATLIFVMATSAARFAAAQDNCKGHFKTDGSLSKGFTYSTYTELGGVDPATALRNLKSQPATGALIRVEAVDVALGTVAAKTLSPTGEDAFSVNFTVATLPTGTRVAVALKMAPGETIEDSNNGLQALLCNFVSLASVAPVKNVVQQELPLNNEEVMKLVAADLGDEIVIAKIKGAREAQLDVSTDALISLKKGNVSKGVIAAMVERAGRTTGVKDDHAARQETGNGRVATGRSGATSAEQLEADLLSQRMILQGLGEVHFDSLSQFIDFKIVSANEQSTVREYKTNVVVGQNTLFSTGNGNKIPMRVLMTMLYTKQNEIWKLANVTIDQVLER